MSDKPVTLIKTPVRLDYTVSAGRNLTTYLRGFTEGKIIGGRCAGCDKVYLPYKGVCPTCAVTEHSEVEVQDVGTVTTFCIIDIPFGKMPFDPPYAAAAILLDGSDLPIFHLVRGIEVDKVRMGLRVKAQWAEELAPTLASIQWFEPNGEPDANYDDYAEHL